MSNTFFAAPTELPTGSGFVIFGTPHCLWLLLISAAVMICTLLGRRFNTRQRRVMKLAICWTMVAGAWSRFLLLLWTGHYNVGFLPLHLCGISVYLCLWNCYQPTVFKQELLYSLTLPGAVLALFFPDWTTYPAWSLITLSSFIIHGGLVIYPLLLLSNGELKPDYHRLPKCFGWLLAVSAAIYIFNMLFHTNFMFLSYPAPHSPLSWFAQYLGNPGYLLGALIILIVIWSVLYGSVIHQQHKKSRTKSRS